LEEILKAIWLVTPNQRQHTTHWLIIFTNVHRKCIKNITYNLYLDFSMYL
jgi:hypothetical protein